MPGQEAARMRRDLDQLQALVDEIVLCHESNLFASDFGQAVRSILIREKLLCTCEMSKNHHISHLIFDIKCDKCDPPPVYIYYDEIIPLMPPRILPNSTASVCDRGT